MTTNSTDWGKWIELLDKCIVSKTPSKSLYNSLVRWAREQGNNEMATLIEYHYGGHHEDCCYTKTRT